MVACMEAFGSMYLNTKQTAKFVSELISLLIPISDVYHILISTSKPPEFANQISAVHQVDLNLWKYVVKLLPKAIILSTGILLGSQSNNTCTNEPKYI